LLDGILKKVFYFAIKIKNFNENKRLQKMPLNQNQKKINYSNIRGKKIHKLNKKGNILL
jgi:hypothetical protein